METSWEKITKPKQRWIDKEKIFWMELEYKMEK